MCQLQIDSFSPLFDFNSLEKTYLTCEAENCTADHVRHLGYPICYHVKFTQLGQVFCMSYATQGCKILRVHYAIQGSFWRYVNEHEQHFCRRLTPPGCNHGNLHNLLQFALLVEYWNMDCFSPVIRLFSVFHFLLHDCV